MSGNKKPVIFVGLALIALMVLPLLFFWWSTRSPGEGGSPVPGANGNATSTAAGGGAGALDFELEQLAQRATALLEGELAEALRRGDVSLDFMSDLQAEKTAGDDDLRRGRVSRAAEHYNRVIEGAEARLEQLRLADRARQAQAQTKASLERLADLRVAFENTYAEAIETYDAGVAELNGARFEAALAQFELADGILGDLEARAEQRVAGLLELGRDALDTYRLKAAQEAFNQVLALAPANAEAEEGLARIEALRGITEEVAAIRELEQSGDLEAALEMVNALLEARPENRFLLGKQAALEAQLWDREFQRLVAESVDFEAADDLESAIASLKSALDLKADPAQSERLARLESVFQARQLERLLADGFAALEAARYEEARDLYRAATDLAPDSEEAQTGLEKASSLYLAEIRYRQNLGAAARYIEDGRFPLAARLFNEAMTSRPNAVAPEQAAAEEDIRQTLEAQSEEVTVTLRSDRRSFVSVIGVQAPDRFRERELRLFPDVYKVRATRSGYRTVEMDLKVDATQPPPTLTVECTERL